MLPLHVCVSRLSRRHSRLLSRTTLRSAQIAFALFCGLSGAALPAQDKADAKAPAAPQDKPAVPEKPAAPVINFRERPKYSTDPQRLRRTVQIDGVLGDTEWEPFYTVSDGPIKGVVYCSWDENFLYLATKTESPATVLFDVDAGGDGWLRGADNLELVIGTSADSPTPTVAARLLDAANSKDTPSWNNKVIDPKSLQVAVKTTGSTQVVEVAIPKNMGSLVLRSGAGIGLRAEFLPPGPAGAYVPTQPFEPHLLLDATLVESRIQGVPGVNPRLTISDNKCIAGQKLFATLELLNQTEHPIPIKSVQWGGLGASANALNGVKEVVVPPIPAMKSVKLHYKTVLPADLTPGSYTLTVTATMEGDRQAQSTVTFSVVEPVQVQMASDPDPVAIAGLTKFTIIVDVFSAAPRGLHGDVELLTVPAGWELQGNLKRGFDVDREDAHKVIRLYFKLPSTTPAGDYPLEAHVTWKGRVWKARHVARVVRTDAPAPTNPETKKN